MKKINFNAGKLLFYTTTIASIILAGDCLAEEIKNYILQIDIEDIYYSTSFIGAASLLGYCVQLGSAKKYIRRYGIDKKSKIPEKDIDIVGVEKIVNSYDDQALMEGWPFRKKKNKKILSGNYHGKAIIYPDKFF